MHDKFLIPITFEITHISVGCGGVTMTHSPLLHPRWIVTHNLWEL